MSTMRKPELTTWSGAELDKLNRLLDQGVSLASCAVRFHCCRNTIESRVRDLERLGLREKVIRAPQLKWTQALLDELVETMISEPNLTRKQLAAKFGVSKNAIAGKVHRLQKAGVLPTSPQTAFRRRHTERITRAKPSAQFVEPPKPEPKKPKQQTPNYSVKHKGGDFRTTEEMAVIRRGHARRKAGLKTSGIADKVLALRATQCRFIFGDTTSPDCAYCEGTRTDESSYCDEHKALTTNPLQPRRQALASRR